MKRQHWLIVVLTSLALVGCTGATAPTVEPEASQSIQATATGSESPPSIAQSTQVVKSGTFASGEHPTTGTASIVTQEDGSISLTLGQDFQTSELGPDLVVILHRSANALSETEPPAYPLNEGDYVVLAPLQQFSGAQTYPIPDTVNLADYSAAGIWCRKFNATFGIAALQ